MIKSKIKLENIDLTCRNGGGGIVPFPSPWLLLHSFRMMESSCQQPNHDSSIHEEEKKVQLQNVHAKQITYDCGSICSTLAHLQTLKIISTATMSGVR